MLVSVADDEDNVFSSFSCPSFSNLCNFLFVMPCKIKRQSDSSVTSNLSLIRSLFALSSQNSSNLPYTAVREIPTARSLPTPQSIRKANQSNPFTLKVSLGFGGKACSILDLYLEGSIPDFLNTYSESRSLSKSMGTDTLVPFSLCRITFPSSKPI